MPPFDPSGAPPPPPNYPPQYGSYPQPGGYPPAPPGYANADEKTFALVAHFGGAVGSIVTGGVLGFVGPLIAYLAKGNQSPTLRAHAVAALNFQILWSIIAFVGVLTACILIGWFVILAAMAMQIIFGIVAGLKANEGILYRYPGSPSFIKG